MPTIRGSANSLILDTPRMYSTATMTKVVRDVKMLLVECLGDTACLQSSHSSSFVS